TARLVNAQFGILAVVSTQATRTATGTRSKTRWAKTVPTSVGQRPFRASIRRVRTATRASSPTRPGSTAFASNPTENAENTRPKRGCGGGTAERNAVSHANERATTERKLSTTEA